MECVLYDFDETLTRRDTTRLLVRAMWRFRPMRVLATAPQLLAMRRARGAPEQLQAAKFRMLGTLIKGLDEAALRPVHQAYVAQVQRIIRADVWAGLEAHLKAGRQVAIVTASPRMAVQAVFEGFAVTVIGTEFASANGQLTGALEGSGCYGAKKVPAIEDWVKSLGVSVRFVEAWSDSWSDAPMMRMAEQRYWICPPADQTQVQKDDPTGHVYHKE